MLQDSGLQNVQRLIKEKFEQREAADTDRRRFPPLPGNIRQLPDRTAGTPTPSASGIMLKYYLFSYFYLTDTASLNVLRSLKYIH